jgi:hypothetical protein
MKTVIASLVLLMLVGCAKKTASTGAIVGKWEFASMTMPGENGAAPQTINVNDGTGIQFDDKNNYRAMDKGGISHDSGTYKMMDDSHVITVGKMSTDTVGLIFSSADTLRISVGGQKLNAVLIRAKVN